tara:strand:+ start:521 stop:1522 length:1002 start_codon:yes stop_codon:yes gene_type:complete
MDNETTKQPYYEQIENNTKGEVLNELVNKQSDDGQLRELALFAGAGGGILGGHLLGWRTICAVEWETYPASILIARQNDRILPPFPVWDDVQTFDGKPWRGRVDIVSGGFPCQDISCAGKGAGIDGERSSMWSHMARIIGEVRPRKVLVENSPMLVGRGLARVIGDIAQMGYDASWGVVGAHNVAAPHKRDRIWIVATDTKSAGTRSNIGGLRGLLERCGSRSERMGSEMAHSTELQRDGSDNYGEHIKPGKIPKPRNGCSKEDKKLADSTSIGQQGLGEHEQPINTKENQDREADRLINSSEARLSWWEFEPDMGGETDGMAKKLDKFKPHD